VDTVAPEHAINVISPYSHHELWVFDDARAAD